MIYLFFFSSRRRHTRSKRDWSSTCALPISSPTVPPYDSATSTRAVVKRLRNRRVERLGLVGWLNDPPAAHDSFKVEIGRASCREGVKGGRGGGLGRREGRKRDVEGAGIRA